MSEGLLKSLRFRDKMHLKLKSSRQTAEQYATLKTNIKTYNKIIKRLIRKLKRQYNGFKEYLGHEQHHNFKCDTITNNETIRIITNIKSKHSCGHDSISTALLKQIKTEISPSITLIVNQCLTTGIFPNKLKIAKVVPVFKKGDKDLLNNYQPISMLPSISKIFETVIYNQLYEYLQEHRVITNSQYGFRKNIALNIQQLNL